MFCKHFALARAGRGFSTAQEFILCINLTMLCSELLEVQAASTAQTLNGNLPGNTSTFLCFQVSWDRGVTKLAWVS